MWFDRPSRQTNECEILHFLRHAFENMLLFFMRTNLIKAGGTHTPIHGLGVELTLQGVPFTRLCSKRVFETQVSPVHWPDGFVIWWASIRAIQLSMAATARVKWLCACVGWCMCASCCKFVLPFFMTYAIYMKGCFLVLFCGVPVYCPESGLF